jgi:transcriptional regulator with XRE-family HTH domain
VTERDRQAPTLGDIIRQQRELAALPLRQLASMVGISNPYLSQIERGLRAPSEQVLNAIAKSLHTSADALHEQANLLAGDREGPTAVESAIAEDGNLTARQRQALLEIYGALVDATIARRARRRGGSADGTAETDEPDESAAHGPDDGVARAAAD